MIELHPGVCPYGEVPDGRLTAGQRRFAVQASHELRTPLTALRLELEEALTHRDAADPYAALTEALCSTERLENTVIALLGLLQRDASGQALGDGAVGHREAAPTGPYPPTGLPDKEPFSRTCPGPPGSGA
ncbi:histidine kinase dimerization/phospho-acceptor domain-containing protein [Actinomadura opuntiae]|uniref:histidine kinase dimerization/phospho-acceptor domain-containing protein n=1 Tax=Actinomadura sp. OS1-43 TaxID=604315 RepID=UPI003341C317